MSMDKDESDLAAAGAFLDALDHVKEQEKEADLAEMAALLTEIEALSPEAYCEFVASLPRYSAHRHLMLAPDGELMLVPGATH